MTRVEESTSESGAEVRTEATEEAAPAEAEVISISSYPPRNPVKVKGIYVSAYVAGTGDMMDRIIEEIDKTELNAVAVSYTHLFDITSDPRPGGHCPVSPVAGTGHCH